MDEDNDVDIDSEFDDEDDYGNGETAASVANMSEAERRAHHNRLERQRRDQIKESFSNLRDVVPALSRERASRARILQSATDYIRDMSTRNNAVEHDIDNLKRQNRTLEQQVRAAERDLTASGIQTVPSLSDAQFRSYAADMGRAPLSTDSSDDEEQEEDDVDLTGGQGPTAASLGASPSNHQSGHTASSSRPRKKYKPNNS